MEPGEDLYRRQLFLCFPRLGVMVDDENRSCLFLEVLLSDKSVYGPRGLLNCVESGSFLFYEFGR